MNEHTALFPAASVNVCITLVTPKGNWSPELWLLSTAGGWPELSVAVMGGQATLTVSPNTKMPLIKSGQSWITGGVLSPYGKKGYQ